MSEGLVILDRDGVINEDSEVFIRSPEQWVAFPQALEAIALLHQAGWQVAVATNQSGIARGYFDESVLTAMHDKMCREVRARGGELVHVAWCPHGPDDASDSRKPRPGMLFEIRDTLGLSSLDGAWMVGDSLRDLQAGRNAGCRVALVLTGKGRITLSDLEQVERPEDVVVADSLLDFARRLLAGELRNVAP
ncbi:D-glycero-beta-D-manno-heptose 1,7-bisphosphate 7-phosphatase [Kushneria phosphatilytica]|uniref:D,D-heptose 1,7-bisphosphate phosphatase n=1 Tax=Kushneria phosphatilytica TaxID=657387 RepID=A0A1S1NTK3_9GAMM|nr:D-glycero-beta-D-manno-heptose 1,7-bisphosphate 7-phosphatase [Kushneria phosphatilytica]OHV08935.1 histidinol phosphate phosphatase [Kushneria phosphatilytica]QEL09685.1 D-glycero-beta-D-manno-heptose 1,7-bisphosphate 7-phosphatase [Kushneria phosphatilytica]